MAGIRDYDRYDAIDLATLIRRRELSAAEVLDEAIRRADASNPRLNALVADCFDAARTRATQTLPESVLAGVPFLIKDITYMRGMACTSGSRLFRDFVPDHDSDIVARYHAAGLLLFGRTSTPEFGLNVSTESVLFGATRNPWNLGRTTGGSSGGSAALVADGVLPAAHATDGGGSIRIPASCCALVGLKPTRARNPQGPDVGEGWGGMSTGHVVSRTVRDSAAFLDATHGPAVGDPYAAPTFDASYLGVCMRAPPPLRIALDTTPITDVSTHSDCIEAARRTARLCESLGHVVEEAAPTFDRLTFRQATGVVVCANVANSVDARLAALGRTLGPNDIEANSRATVEYGRSLTAPRYAAAMQTIHQTARAVARFHETYDVMLTPTLVAPPVELGWLDTTSTDFATFSDRFSRFWGFTNLQNATGQPAISLPLHWNADNLPIGVQFVGRFGADALLLQLAAQLERAQPWFDRRPSRGAA